MKVVSPGFEGMDNSKELMVINVVVLFCRGEGLGQIEAGMPFSIGVCLKEDGT